MPSSALAPQYVRDQYRTETAVHVSLPKWARRFTGHARYKCMYGGRGSSKTWTTAHLIVLRAARERVRVACCREFQSSISESAKPAIEVAIRRLGLSHMFDVQEHVIRGHNGSHFFFRGMERSRESIRGWEDVDIVWVEEAQRLSNETAKVLIPTIRKNGAELWFTWNPKYRTDWVWRRFVINPRDGDMIHKVNYDQNPWFPASADEERRSDKRVQPELYDHIWLGEPDDEGEERKVLPRSLIQPCIDAWDEHGKHEVGRSPYHAGLDVADSGKNLNAYVIRCGASITHVEQWRAKSLGETTRRAHGINESKSVSVMYYDVGGVGAGVRSHLMEISGKRYISRPLNFGQKVAGEKTQYTRSQTNVQFFNRRSAQLAWALRLRAQRTQALVNDPANAMNIDPHHCLFIDPSIPRLEDYLSQLTQPAWEETMAGKLTVKKIPDDEPSPDMYDATALAFASDSKAGLRALQ